MEMGLADNSLNAIENSDLFKYSPYKALTEEQKDALVVVPDDQLSLAIGREGQNVRLAHRLTGWKIDIKSVSQMEADEAAGVNVHEVSSNYEDEDMEERAVDSDEIQEEIEEEMSQQEYDEEDLAQETEDEAEESSEEE